MLRDGSNQPGGSHGMFNEQTTRPKVQSRWHSSSKNGEMDGIVTTTLTLDSSNLGGVAGLTIRCGGEKADIYIYLNDYVQPE